jgi:hypothetical protein
MLRELWTLDKLLSPVTDGLHPVAEQRVAVEQAPITQALSSNAVHYRYKDDYYASGGDGPLDSIYEWRIMAGLVCSTKDHFCLNAR